MSSRSVVKSQLGRLSLVAVLAAGMSATAGTGIAAAAQPEVTGLERAVEQGKPNAHALDNGASSYGEFSGTGRKIG